MPEDNNVNAAILERLEKVVESLQDNSVKMGQLLLMRVMIAGVVSLVPDLSVLVLQAGKYVLFSLALLTSSLVLHHLKLS